MPDNLLAILSIAELAIMFISACLVIPQIILLRKQAKENHAEHRRENTVNMLNIWSNSIRKETAEARRITNQFSEEQCAHLYRKEPFSVTEEVKENICRFCFLNDECENCKLKDGNTLEGEILNELRYHVVYYLNMLETVMTSWYLGIVDKETIEEQFEFLTKEGNGMALTTFRRVAGGYPLIESFMRKINEQPHSPKRKL